MGKLAGFTIIDDKNTRGIIGPTSFLSKELLEDILDLIKYSNPKMSRKINQEFRKNGRMIEGKSLRKKLAV
jgi:hypothetical protein